MLGIITAKNDKMQVEFNLLGIYNEKQLWTPQLLKNWNSPVSRCNEMEIMSESYMLWDCSCAIQKNVKRRVS